MTMTQLQHRNDTTMTTELSVLPPISEGTTCAEMLTHEQHEELHSDDAVVTAGSTSSATNDEAHLNDFNRGQPSETLTTPSDENIERNRIAGEISQGSGYSMMTLPMPLEPQHSRKQQFQCLYTSHKTQKRKKWRDGRLVLSGIRVFVYDASPAMGAGDPVLDECELTQSQKQTLINQSETRVDTEIETEKFLIQVEGSWTKPCATKPFIKSKPTRTETSKSLRKVMERKFQKPAAVIPPTKSNLSGTGVSNILRKRRRPLQPGELQRRYYGGELEERRKQHSPAPPSGNPNLSFQRQIHQSTDANGNTIRVGNQHHSNDMNWERRREAHPISHIVPPPSHHSQPLPFELNPESTSRGYHPATETSYLRSRPKEQALCTRTRCGFVESGDFNANNFYGIEDEGTHHENPNVTWSESVDGPGPATFSIECAAAERRGRPTTRNDGANSRVSDVVRPSQNATTIVKSDLNESSSTMTGSQLFALFAAPKLSQTTATRAQEAEKAPTNPEKQQLRFFLPSHSSESSSDESE